MDITEALDREVIIERAEAVRFWLLGLHLSSRATGAIQRELGAIIDNDPGTYINGQRPLAGLTVADFIAELHHANGGAVGRVKSIGQAALNELRAKIPANAGTPQEEPEPDYTLPELDTSQAVAPNTEGSEAVPLVAAPIDATETSQAEAQPARRRGRPKGSKKTEQNGAAVFYAAPELAEASPEQPTAAVADEVLREPKRRRGRPRREARPESNVQIVDTPGLNDDATLVEGVQESVAGAVPSAAGEDQATATNTADQPLNQLVRLWSGLHPHARRAVVMYVSTLWAEDAYKAGS
jgi:hypothetical protein